MKISTHIFDLLREHDCVIIPDFGAFVTRNVSAKISSDGSKIFPQKKKYHSIKTSLKMMDCL